MSPPIGPEGRERATAAPDEPSGLRSAVRRLLARLVRGFGAGRGAAETADFDVAARRAYQAARLDIGSRAPASPVTRPADELGLVPVFAATAEPEAPVRTARPSLPEVRVVDPAGRDPEPVSAMPRRPPPGEAALGSLLRTPSTVTSIADEFFDSLVRRVESDG